MQPPGCLYNNVHPIYMQPPGCAWLLGGYHHRGNCLESGSGRFVLNGGYELDPPWELRLKVKCEGCMQFPRAFGRHAGESPPGGVEADIEDDADTDCPVASSAFTETVKLSPTRVAMLAGSTNSALAGGETDRRMASLVMLPTLAVSRVSPTDSVATCPVASTVATAGLLDLNVKRRGSTDES